MALFSSLDHRSFWSREPHLSSARGFYDQPQKISEERYRSRIYARLAQKHFCTCSARGKLVVFLGGNRYGHKRKNRTRDKVFCLWHKAQWIANSNLSSSQVYIRYNLSGESANLLHREKLIYALRKGPGFSRKSRTPYRASPLPKNNREVWSKLVLRQLTQLIYLSNYL